MSGGSSNEKRTIRRLCRDFSAGSSENLRGDKFLNSSSNINRLSDDL